MKPEPNEDTSIGGRDDYYVVDTSIEPWTIEFLQIRQIRVYPACDGAYLEFTAYPGQLYRVQKGQYVTMQLNGAWLRIIDVFRCEGEALDMSRPIPLAGEYNYAISYEFPGPLSCGSYSEGCSDLVDGGHHLGTGRFCDYMVLCAGLVVTILYNRFEREA